jgi:hypothetical protein
VGDVRAPGSQLVRADPLGEVARRVHQGDLDLRREPEGAHQPRVSRADHNDMLIG